MRTLDTKKKNHGMAFDAELMPYCGGIYRVRARVERFIDEQTGYMKRMKTPAVILEGVILSGPLQQSPHVLPASYLFLVARNLVGARSRQRTAANGRRE